VMKAEAFGVVEHLTVPVAIYFFFY